jgi:3-isopropylmalate dehydrogenase
MFGDILSDQASEIAGSLGLAASINHGAEHGVAQAQHGSAPDIAGQDRANPTSLILSAGMLLAWLGERRGNAALTQAAACIADAVDTVLAQPHLRTADLGGPLGTQGFGRAVAQVISMEGENAPAQQGVTS